MEKLLYISLLINSSYGFYYFFKNSNFILEEKGTYSQDNLNFTSEGEGIIRFKTNFSLNYNFKGIQLESKIEKFPEKIIEQKTNEKIFTIKIPSENLILENKILSSSFYGIQKFDEYKPPLIDKTNVSILYKGKEIANLEEKRYLLFKNKNLEQKIISNINYNTSFLREFCMPYFSKMAPAFNFKNSNFQHFKLKESVNTKIISKAVDSCLYNASLMDDFFKEILSDTIISESCELVSLSDKNFSKIESLLLKDSEEETYFVDLEIGFHNY
jgi:hypothetical protein